MHILNAIRSQKLEKILKKYGKLLVASTASKVSINSAFFPHNDF